MLELIRMSSNTETSVTEFCYKSVNLLLEERINIKVILFLLYYKTKNSFEAKVGLKISFQPF